ncbi:MAG: S41 family peptidase, partial [Proteobacteria bacterium]|nr:S41 family peptidase [Pseudomonadota bacterium]
MTRRSKWLGGFAVLLITFATGLMAGIVLTDQVLFAFVPPARIPASADDDFALMAEAWNLIDRVYVDRSAVQPKKMAEGGIAGMVDSLGDTGHSTFLTPEMVKESQNELTGEFQGVGAELRMKDGHVTIVAPMDNSPAQKAGIRPGDVILKVDGKDIAGLPLEEVVKGILGPAGTQVTLTLETPSRNRVRDVTLTRAHITVHNVTWHVLPGTDLAHLRIASFSRGVTQDLQAALKEIHAKNLAGAVLDLRNNPGGLLEEAIGGASQFLTGGNVLLEKDADGEITPMPVVQGGVAPDLPLVVLINEGTASGAEILAGALQDARRATLVGATTFGTGTVLREFPLSDGSAVMLAVREWLTPNGHTIWHAGIKPQLVVALSPDTFPVFPEAERDMTAAQIETSGDQQ